MAGDDVDRWLREWTDLTAELADRLAAVPGVPRARRRRITQIVDALFQAKVFVELIAAGQSVGVTIHGQRKK